MGYRRGTAKEKARLGVRAATSKALRFIASYARASMHLHLAAWSDDGDGKLRDVDVVLCEDNRSVMSTHTQDGRALTANFELPEPTTEDAFNASEYVTSLQGEIEADGKTEP